MRDSASRTQSLDGVWRLALGPQVVRAADSNVVFVLNNAKTIPAQVPGNVELDMIAAGVLANALECGNRIYSLREIECYQWHFERTFNLTVNPESDGDRVHLVFDGLDCFATVWLNGVRIGRAANMLVPQSFDVTATLRRDGENVLTVIIDSPVLEARRRTALPGEYHSGPLNWESLAVRKAPHMYGWDIMPRALSAGMWRSVRLEMDPRTRWRSVYFATITADPHAGTATLSVDWDFTSDRTNLDELAVRLTLSREGRVTLTEVWQALSTHGRAKVVVPNAALWWPHGAGDSALYDVSLELIDQSASGVLAVHRCRIGLRTVRLVRTDLTDDTGKGDFAFVVNGRRFFIKGTNWSALDAFHSRDMAHLPTVFEMLVELNCNMVRCWGGNVYESDAFFDSCDEAGVMVWQDFAFGCGIYPQDDEFAGVVEAEASSVVTRLRNHASLVLWAGNNENDEAYEWAELPVDPNTDRISREVLPRVIRTLDPFRAYLPSSPYRSPEYVRRGNPPDGKPEDHLWGPRDDFKGSFYSNSSAHFVSEIGYHGCPDRETLERMFEADYVWPWEANEQWLTHAVRDHPGNARCNYRIALMAKQAAVLFGKTPTELDEFIFASQVSQAEALKYFIERFRADAGRRTGILWWNLRDGWPIISDAVVDYYNRKKLAYHYIQRAQSDVCVIVREPDSDGRHAVVVANDTAGVVTGHLSIRDADTDHVLLETEFEAGTEKAANVAHLASSKVRAMWLIDLTTASGTVVRNHYLAGPRPFDLNQYARWMKLLHLPEPCGVVEWARTISQRGSDGE
jgi:beta-mannosidase